MSPFYKGQNVNSGGGVYSYVHVLSNEFLLKSIFQINQFEKKSVGQNISPPINVLVTALGQT